MFNIMITFYRPVGSHLRLIGLRGNLSLPIFISYTSNVSTFCQKLGNPNTILQSGSEMHAKKVVLY